jgi:hypothetical protein
MQMRPPPVSLGLNGVTRGLALLFERAFSRQGSQPKWPTAPERMGGGTPRPRTTPEEMRGEPRASVRRHAEQMPVVRNRGGYRRPAIPGCGGRLGPDWFHHCRILGKGKFGAEPWPTPYAPRCYWWERHVVLGGSRTSTGHFRCETRSRISCAGSAPSRIQSLKKEIATKAADARSRWQNLQTNWARHTSSEEFQVILADLQNLKSRYEALPQKRLQELQRLEKNRYQLQLHAHLDRCRISRAHQGCWGR